MELVIMVCAVLVGVVVLISFIPNSPELPLIKAGLIFAALALFIIGKF